MAENRLHAVWSERAWTVRPDHAEFGPYFNVDREYRYVAANSSHLKDPIEIIAKHEQDFLARRTRAERIGDFLGGFIGSLRFVCIHLGVFAAWILGNTLQIGTLHHFDPAPFPLLDTVVAIEAIFLASFIVMRQSRLSRRSDEREHLMLQVLILAEKEITAVLNTQRQIAVKSGLAAVRTDAEIALSEETSIDEVARTIRESLPSE